MTIEEERAALRLQMIADAEADLTKDIDPRDEDAGYMRGLAKTLATDIVDAVIADGDKRRIEDRARVPSKSMTPAEWSAVVRQRLDEIATTGLPEFEYAGRYNPETGRIEGEVSQRAGTVIRPVGEKA